MKLADSQSSRQRPKCLSPEFETPEGYWDPERWFRSFDNSRGSSPLSLGGRDRTKRPIDLERDLLKRRTSGKFEINLQYLKYTDTFLKDCSGRIKLKFIK